MAICSLKTGKAPGVDQVSAEAIKAGRDTLLHRLHALLKTIWRTERIPLAWKKAVIVPIHKKGDNRDCSNYRGISLLSIVGKVFTKIIQANLQKHRKQTSREEQANFRPNRSCCAQIFTIQQLLEEDSMWPASSCSIHRFQNGIRLHTPASAVEVTTRTGVHQ